VKLHRKQAEFRHSPALYRGFVGGRGAGKSWVGAYDLIRRAKRDRTYLVASPTGVLMQDTTFPTFQKIARELGVWGGVKLTPYPNVSLTTGATVRFRTAEDPEKMRGPNLSGVWLDEASLMGEDSYTIAIASLREAGEQGWLSATFTPKGVYHWTYEVFGQDRADTALIRSPTSDNPFNPAGFAETLAKQYTPLFARQELGGEFLEIEGAYWPAAWFPEEHWFDKWPDKEDIRFRAAAVDSSLGKRRAGKEGDYSAIVFFASDRHGRIWVEADLERRPITQVFSDGLSLVKRWHRETGGPLDGFGVESDVFQVLAANEFRRQSAESGLTLPVYEVYTGGVDKHQRVLRLTPYLSSGCFRWRNTPGTQLLVRQAREFPVGAHDDGIDSLEMAIRMSAEVWNAKQPS
jgi:predicted phage terminase large subunit-like protein